MNARPRDTVAALQHKVNNVNAQKKSEICVEMKSVHRIWSGRRVFKLFEVILYAIEFAYVCRKNTGNTEYYIYFEQKIIEFDLR